MRYWPLSTIAASPLMPAWYVPELCRAYDHPGLSEGAMVACNQVAGQTRPVETPLIIVHSVGAPLRRVYLEYPDFESWARLERGGFVATEDTFGFVIDALH